MDFLFIFGAKYLIYILILVYVLFVLTRQSNVRKKMILFALISLPLTYVLGGLASLMYHNPRPFIADGIVPLISHSASNGFPSDHALLSISLALAVFVFSRRAGLWFFLFAWFVAISRVYVGVHHWIDIFGSLVICVIGALIVYYIFKLYAKESSFF